MTATTDTRTKGRHRAGSNPQPTKELLKLHAENHELHCALQRAKTVIHALTGELATQAGKAVCAEAQVREQTATINRLRQQLRDRWNIRPIHYPARTPMYVTDVQVAIDPARGARGLALALLFEADPAAFNALNRRPVAVQDPAATQPVAIITAPDGDTTLTLPRPAIA